MIIFVPCSQIRCSLFPFLYQFSMGWRQNYPNIQQRRHWSQSEIFLETYPDNSNRLRNTKIVDAP
ncbi:hypothetical protein [Moorena sp. SIO3H5]|uniref:hypothetical protein n=1 Tax=Moorena sp. SIO3H5 TaxID=2607834 RepID=UPI0013BDDE10|nr:hypothetical protein [Moorena sp. SIO3H5]NEO73444.1 hypothetical protein [Moorena sp. SIO3H5]